jgi:hypothetical protein
MSALLVNLCRLGTCYLLVEGQQKLVVPRIMLNINIDK